MCSSSHGCEQGIWRKSRDKSRDGLRQLIEYALTIRRLRLLNQNGVGPRGFFVYSDDISTPDSFQDPVYLDNTAIDQDVSMRVRGGRSTRFALLIA